MGSTSSKHIKSNSQLQILQNKGADSGILSDVSRTQSDQKEPKEHYSKASKVKKVVNPVNTFSIYDPASDKYILKSVVFQQ